METKTLNEISFDAYPENIKKITNEDGTIELIDVNKRVREAFRLGYMSGQSDDFVKSIRDEVKKSILSRLPKWKIADRDIDSDSLEYLVKYKHNGGDYSDWEEAIPTNRLHKGEQYMEIADLIELSV